MKPNSGANLDHLQNQSDENVGMHDPLIGTILAGHLELLSRIGMGGMSVVYKAKELQLNRMVAVKILLPHVAFDPRGIRRFRQEALAVSKLDHPNIIRVYEFQIPEDGQPFLVMDLVEGQSLQDFINKNGPIESTRAISLLAQVCTGLEHAHKYGVIHRDLKPGNIMLLKDPESMRQVVKIVDFGLAKLLQDESDASQGLTRTGDIFGSPLYMSPEQCLCGSLDVRSDVYSLGCVMYEVLTGQPPLKGKTILNTIQMQISQYPASLAQVNDRIRMVGQLDSVLFKAMAKDPGQRYQTIEEFRHALEDIKASAQKDGFFEKLKLTLQIRQSKTCPGSRGLSTLVWSGLTILPFIVAAVIFIFHARHHGVDPPITGFKAEQQWLKLENDAQIYFDSGQYPQAERAFTEELKIAEHLPPEYEKASLEGLIDVCYVMNKAADPAWSAKLGSINATMLDTTQITQDLLNVQNAEDAKRTIARAIALTPTLKNSCKSESAGKMLSNAVNVGKRFLEPNDSLLADCIRAQADMLKIEEWNSNSELDLRRNVESIYESKHQSTFAFARAQEELAGMYLRKKNWPESKTWFLKALETFKKTEGEAYYGEIAQCEYNLAVCDGYLEQYDEATAFLKKSQDDLKRLTPNKDLDKLSAGQLKFEKWNLLKYDNWLLWADLERHKAKDDTNVYRLTDKTIECLNKALAAANAAGGQPEKAYPEILECEKRIAKELIRVSQYQSALPRELHSLASTIRLEEPVKKQMEPLEKTFDCYVGIKDLQKSAEYANRLVNAGSDRHNSYLAHILLQLNKDPAEVLKYAVRGADYTRKEYSKALSQKRKDDNDNDDDTEQSENAGNDKTLPHARERLRLAYAQLVEAQAYIATGNISMSRTATDNATKLLAPYTLKNLAEANKKKTHQSLYLQVKDLEKQVQLQLSSKHL